MKKIPAFLAGLFVAGIVAFLLLAHQVRLRREAETEVRLACAGQTVRTALDELKNEIGERLAAFAEATKSDRMFSLRLLAENNPTAPEVIGRASEYLGPMGFSFLDITDSAGTIVSSGRFPADAGNSMAKKLSLLTSEPRFLMDGVPGNPVPSLQAATAFTVADCITFHAAGGIVIDTSLLNRLAPCEGVTVFLRCDTTILGLQDVQKISDVRNHRIIINDKEYPAIRLPLPAAEGTHEPVLIVVLMKPAGR
jgi:hypothetical protein